MNVTPEIVDLMRQLQNIKQEKLSLIRPQLESLLVLHAKGEHPLVPEEVEMLTRAVECLTMTDIGINKNLFNIPTIDGPKLSAMSPERRALYVSKVVSDFDAAANQLISHVTLMHQIIEFTDTGERLSSYATAEGV